MDERGGGMGMWIRGWRDGKVDERMGRWMRGVEGWEVWMRGMGRMDERDGKDG